MSGELALQVWLALACGTNTGTPAALLEALGDVVSIYAAEEEELEEAGVTNRKVLTALCNKDLNEANAVVKWCEDYNVGILTLSDKNYPERLRSIKNPPAVLYYIGRLPDFDSRLCVATVGTRRISEYGRINAYKISYDLTKAGTVIVSGLADGIDSVCHRAALDALGSTVAVLGCGIDNVYPKHNRDLMKEIARKGTLITEYPPGTKPIGYNFPARNRIISGLSQATVVFEADRKSGALITAKFAADAGRAVYALPGEVGELNSLGTNDLIRSGAKILVEADDLLSDFEPITKTRNTYVPALPISDKVKQKSALKRNSFPKEVKPEKTKVPKRKASPSKQESETDENGLSSVEQSIYSILRKATPKTFDDFIALGHTVPEITAALTMLEIKGMIISMPGGTYTRS